MMAFSGFGKEEEERDRKIEEKKEEKEKKIEERMKTQRKTFFPQRDRKMWKTVSFAVYENME